MRRLYQWLRNGAIRARRVLPQKRSGLIVLLLSLLVFIPAFSFFIFFLYCEWTVDSHMRSQKWTFPSTIYADGPVLYAGMPMRQGSLIAYIQRLNYHRNESGKPVLAGEYVVKPQGIQFRKRPFFQADEQNDVISVDFDTTSIVRVVDENNQTALHDYALEPVPIRDLVGGEWEKRTLVSYKDVPKPLIDAVIAIEDRRFYKHHGVDYEAVLRALWNNIRSGSLSEGGSTITQQLVKNEFLTPEKSLRRKFSEAVMSSVLESRLNKEQILELYLNEIYLGQRGSMSIKGAGEASRLFFRKDASHLTVPEAALLAGMIRSPNPFNPYRHPKEAKTRRNIVLEAMKDQGYLSPAECEKYSKAPLVVYPFDDGINLAPYFGDLVKTQMLTRFDENTLYKKNLRIFTTLDLGMQQAAEESLAEGLRNIDRLRFTKTGKKVQGCLIAIEPKTGYIRAFVGGRSYSNSQFNRVVQALRQPGSVFKPVVYATALEQAFAPQPRIFTTASLVKDEPWMLLYSTDSKWEPKNYDGQYHGTVTLRTALAHSMNVATARLAVSVGLEKIAAMGQQLGFVIPHPYPSMALGAFEVSPLQVAQAYTVFANGGMKTELKSVREVTDSDGKVLNKEEPQAQRVLHAQTAFVITDMMRSVLLEGTAASVTRYGFTRIAAGKTGTTDDFRDAWFVGYTPDLLCVVWTGYDDNSPIQMNGAQAALPIWAAFMKRATSEMPPSGFPVPSGITARTIDPTTGDLATDSCPARVQEIFIAGTEPTQYCEYHQNLYAESDFSTWYSNREPQEIRAKPIRQRRGGFWGKFKRWRKWF